MHDRFTVLTPDKTMWKRISEYQYTGSVMEMMGLFFQGMFRKQTLEAMQNFQASCEEGTDVGESA